MCHCGKQFENLCLLRDAKHINHASITDLTLTIGNSLIDQSKGVPHTA